MANLTDHLDQARHNDIFARELDEDINLKYWDWLITVSFYAAVHYVEAIFFVEGVQHTETAHNPDEGMHDYREKTVRRLLGSEVWKSYRKLRDASYNARYLAYQAPTKVAIKYYTKEHARRFYSFDLDKVRNAARVKLNL